MLSEFHLPLVHTDSASLFDYLPPRALVLVDDLSLVELMANEVDEHAVKFRKESIAEGILPIDFPTPYLTWSELADGLKIRPWIELGHSTAEEMGESSESLTHIFIPGQRFSGRLKPFIDHLVNIISKGHNVVIASRQSSRLKDLWIGQSLNAQTDNPIFLEVSLSGGWRLDHNCAMPIELITDNEIFGWERPQPRQRQHLIAETPESVYGDLRPFDWVVHVDHGIGRYLGLVQRALEGYEREFLCVEYEGGDQLYVPIHQADRLTRYIGSDSGIPSPSRLGGAEWHQTKSRVTESLQQVAEELLDLYSRRQV
jgi:transcription-repair coupling factor (superfamily II helicase)